MDYLNNIPPEVWDAISDQLHDARDLHNLVRVCRAFWARRHRTLLGVITWDNFPQESSAITFLQNHPTLSVYTRSLTVKARLSGYHLPREGDEPHNWEDWFARVHPPMVGLNGSTHPRPSEMSHPCGFFIHLCKAWRILHGMYSFTSLQRLTFYGLQLTAADLTLALHFPHIRQLEIVTCQFFPPIPLNPHNSNRDVCSHSLPLLLHLPITHLTLLDLEGPLTNQGTLLAEDELNKVAALAACPSLQHLRFDVSSRVTNVVKGRHFPPSPLDMILDPPPQLLSLEALLPRQDTYGQEPAARSEHRRIEVVASNLASFLAQCPALTSLTIHGYLPYGPFCVGSRGALLKLEVLRGPEAVLRAITPANTALRVLDVYEGISPVEFVVRELGRSIDMARYYQGCSCVEELRVYADGWDEEIIGVSQVAFSQTLRTLDIRYRVGGPDENALLSLGPRLFNNFPALECVYIYRIILPRPKKTPKRFWRDAAVEHVEEPPSYVEAEVQPMARVSDEHLSVHIAGAEVDMSDENMGRIPTDAVGEEMQAVVAKFWGKSCPGLREIGLKAGEVWRRQGERGVWQRMRCHFEGSRRVVDTEG